MSPTGLLASSQLLCRAYSCHQLGKAYHLRHKEEYVPDFLHFPFMVA